MRILVILSVIASAAAHGAGAPHGAGAAHGAAPAYIGAEIRRGADAAFGCQIAGAERPMDGAAYLECLDARQQANRAQMGRGYEPFEAGLWYTARGRFRALLAVAPGGPAASNVDVAAAGLSQAERGSGVSDSDVWRALHPQPGEAPPDAHGAGGGKSGRGRAGRSLR